MYRILYVLVLFSVLIFGCNSASEEKSSAEKPTHPLHGKWKLAIAGDSVVLNNDYEIYMEFTEDGKIINSSPDEIAEGNYILSDDTSLITVMEGGKPVTEYKIFYLTESDLAIKEGEDIIKFVKVK